MTGKGQSPVHQFKNGVLLYPLGPEHAEGLRQFRNLGHDRCGFRDDSLISQDQQHAWVNSHFARTDDHMWVALDTGGTVVGAAALYEFDWDARDAQIGRIMFNTRRVELRGIGSMLIDWVSCQARTWGA